MCGRFTQYWTWAELRRASAPFWEVPDFDAQPPARLNLAPTQSAQVIRQTHSGSGAVTLAPLHWGFERAGGGEVINARAETASTMPMFRDAAASRRCLVPTNGFYEWETLGDGSKQPWHLAAGPVGTGAEVFFLAGLWSAASRGERFVTLTAPTPDGFEPAIHHRMPLVVCAEHGAAWLDPSLDAARALALATPFGDPGAFAVRAWPVSTRVNSASNEGADLLTRVEPQANLFRSF